MSDGFQSSNLGRPSDSSQVFSDRPNELLAIRGAVLTSNSAQLSLSNFSQIAAVATAVDDMKEDNVDGRSNLKSAFLDLPKVL